MNSPYGPACAGNAPWHHGGRILLLGTTFFTTTHDMMCSRSETMRHCWQSAARTVGCPKTRLMGSHTSRSELASPGYSRAHARPTNDVRASEVLWWTETEASALNLKVDGDGLIHTGFWFCWWPRPKMQAEHLNLKSTAPYLSASRFKVRLASLPVLARVSRKSTTSWPLCWSGGLERA